MLYMINPVYLSKNVILCAVGCDVQCKTLCLKWCVNYFSVLKQAYKNVVIMKAIHSKMFIKQFSIIFVYCVSISFYVKLME